MALHCPYCDKTKNNEAGMSMHVKYMHPEKWKKTLKNSIPDQMHLGTPTHSSRKGKKKTPIYNKCPFCSYDTVHPPAMALHIKGSHPKKWKGNLGSSMGKTPSRDWKTQDYSTILKERNRRYQQARRDANIALGLTSGGKPRKQSLRTTYKPAQRRRIKPIVYFPAQEEINKPELSLMDKVIDKIAEKLAAKLLE